jgi:hypothetical protein
VSSTTQSPNTCHQAVIFPSYIEVIKNNNKGDDNMIATLFSKIDTFRAKRVRQSSRYGLATADIPPTLYAYWKSTAHNEFKGIPSDAFFFARATEGLLTFFDCVRTGNKPCALPSAAADSVWHAWAKLAPAQLEQFCKKHFGRTIPHTEAADMSDAMDAALANSLAAARRLDKLPAAGASVPALFALDRKLRMPGGYAYTAAAGQIGFRHINERGVEEGKRHLPAALAPAALLAAGLISQQEYDVSLQKAHPDGSGCGAGCGSFSSDSGSGSPSACGSHCGTSCGSSCGGGCGS